MYNLNDIKEVHLEVTNKCQARCPMCPRRIYGGPINPLIKIEEVSLEIFKKWFHPAFLEQIDSLFMCGNLGDPILARDTLKIYKYLRKINPTIKLSMHTNGSGRTQSWWKQLAELKVRVVFGIDGTDLTHSKYRINTNWHLIIKNAQRFIDSGGDAEWHMLVFDHNQHEIERCREISLDMGFVDFKIKHTSRFQEDSWTVLSDNGQTVDILYPSTGSLTIKNKIKKLDSDIKNSLSDISCKAKNGKQIYVTANGFLTPCCWLDFSWVPAFDKFRIDYMDKIREMPNLNEYTLDEIFSSGYFQTISDTWNTDSCLKKCSQQCGIINKRDIQFEKN